MCVCVSATGHTGHSRGLLASPIQPRTGGSVARPADSSSGTLAGGPERNFKLFFIKNKKGRTEGHVSDNDLTCSRLISAHLPTGRTARETRRLPGAPSDPLRPPLPPSPLSPVRRLAVRSPLNQNGGTRLLEVLPLDLYFHVQVDAHLGQVAADYSLGRAEFQVSLVFHLYQRNAQTLWVCA